MSQEYTPVDWVDETPNTPGTLINKARLDQMQTAHHYADGFEEVDTTPTADPGVDYHKVVFCTADTTFYRWDGTQWVKDVDDTTKALLEAHEADHANPHVVTKAQVGLGNCDNTSDLDKPVSTATQTALDGKVNVNTPITGATKCKITYDSKGLVTAGTDLAESDVPVLSISKIMGLPSALDAKLDDSQLKTSWSSPVSDANIPSEKLTKDTLDAKVDDTQIVTAWSGTVSDDNIPSEKLTKDTIDLKADKATTLAEYGINDAYTKAQVDASVDTRVKIADGVTEWSSAVTYTANAFCARNGTLYRSLSANNVNHDPLSSTGWWEEYASGSKQSTGLIGPDNVYTEDIGDGSSTTIAVTHGLTSYDVMWCLWSNTDKGVTAVKAVKTSVDVLTLTFAIAPATDEYRVLVFRPGDAARIFAQTFAPSGNDVVITHNLGRLPAGISLYAPDGTRVGVRMTVDTTTITLHFAGYDNGNYKIEVVA